MEQPRFASPFPTPSWDEWRALAETALKGAGFEKTLVSHSRDGIRIEPLYPKASPAPTPWRERPGPWRVAQRLDQPDPVEANALAHADLAGGADALTIVAAGAPSARGFGLRIDGPADLDAALDGVMLDLIHLRLNAGAGGVRAAGLMLDLAERRGHRLADLDIDLGLDPIGALAVTGLASAPWPEASASLAEAVRGFRDRGFTGRAVLADGRPFHEAGASEGGELAAILSSALAYLRALEAGGLSLEAARDLVAFLVVADSDAFLSIAKLRALRRLWAEIERGCGLDPRPARIHAETAWRMTTRRDPWVNLLRGTLAGFAAGIGGADSVTILPFTAALGLPDAFARRLARNTQTILLEESNLWRVADPVAGAGGFEALTDGLCEVAWAEFRQIEREGGLVASLESGALQQRIAVTRAERDKAIATRREPITGTSEFPDIRETPVSVLMPAPPQPLPSAEAVSARALPSIRLAAPFEALRDRADAVLARTGSRPAIFLANLGPLAAFSARAGFARNVFEAGGIEALGNDGFASLDAMTAAFAASGARMACLCSSDAVYAEEAAEAALRLKTAGAAQIYLAGRPGAHAERFGVAGVGPYIHTGSDLVAVLSAFHDAAEAALSQK